MAYNKETGMYEGFIYKIVNNNDSNQIYIGQTIRTIKTRYYEHIFNAKKNDLHNHLYNAMRLYGIDNYSIIEIEKYEFEDIIDLQKKLNEREMSLIKNYRDKNYDVLNDSDGGDSPPGDKHKIPVLQYSLKCKLIKEYDSISDASMKTGIPSSQISACCSSNSQVICTGGFIWRKADNPLTTEEIDLYTKKYKNGVSQIGRKVSMYSLDKEYIRSFNSLSEAAKETQTNMGSISSVCLNKNKTAGGYIWRFFEEDISTYLYDPYNKKKPCKRNIKNKESNNKPIKYDIQVEQRDIKTGELINIFDNYIIASRNTGIQKANILHCCLNISNYAGGYYWCFVGEFLYDNLKKSKYHTSYDMYSIDGDYIKSFNSLSEIYEFLGNNNTSIGSDIIQVCKGHRKTARGYVWRFSGDPFYLNYKEVKYA